MSEKHSQSKYKSCYACGIEWEKGTRIVQRGTPMTYAFYHVGCWAKLAQLPGMKEQWPEVDELVEF